MAELWAVSIRGDNKLNTKFRWLSGIFSLLGCDVKIDECFDCVLTSINVLRNPEQKNPKSLKVNFSRAFSERL
jgi:hypothetical protein